ncbi:MAG: biopolymer transporter ExbD [Pseudomonadota bacterium]
MRLRPPKPPGRLITLVPLVDAMLILLVFFLVTSTYLDLDRLPLAETRQQAGAGAGPADTLLVRLAPDGTAVISGRPVGDLETAARVALGPDPVAGVLLFPSPAASVQALVSAMEALTRAGAPSIRIVRTDAP